MTGRKLADKGDGALAFSGVHGWLSLERLG